MLECANGPTTHGADAILNEKGILVLKRPFPNLTPTIWGDAERYGNDYWEKTGPFWKSVRTTWSELLENHQTLQLDSVKLKSSPMFMTLFGLADQFSDAKNTEEMQAKVKQAISNYLSLD